MAYTTNTKIGRVRGQAVYMVQSGRSTREVTRYFGYAQSTIVKWCQRSPQRVRKNGSLQKRMVFLIPVYGLYLGLVKEGDFKLNKYGDSPRSIKTDPIILVYFYMLYVLVFLVLINLTIGQ